MTEMEKVIKAFEFCLMPPSREELENDICSHEDCPYYREYNGGKCVSAAARDALALLKAQEPRVMTSAEVEAWLMIGRVDRTPIVIEVRDKFIAWVVGDEYYDLPECDLSGEFYNKTWRCWTSRPTDEQREAVKWV